MNDFNIASIRTHEPAIVTGDGDKLLAHVNVEIGGCVVICGCVLLYDEACDRIRLAMPRASRSSRTIISDRDLRQRILNTALNMYRAATGATADTPFAKAPIVASET